ncbi:MAG: YceI family protein [Chitinophagaceae bacterium]|nr:MAG: YceI family protein [Chitinophagaceae bacterium]
MPIHGWFLALWCLLAVATVQAQGRYFTKTGRISFTSHAPLEDIEAVNKTASAVLDAKTGQLQFAVLMKGFEFKKALMQEHFNENYVESHKYPKAEFRGSIVNNADVNYTKDGTYQARARGQLSLHGVTRDIDVPATLQVQGGKVEGRATFPVRVADYNITIPSLVKDKISNTVNVTVQVRLEPLAN